LTADINLFNSFKDIITEQLLEDARQQKERKFWDAYAKHYDALIRRLQSTYTLIIDFAREHIDPTTDVLEVAAGTGNIALGVADLAAAVRACDISPEMIRIAEQKLAATRLPNITFTVQDGYALSYPDKSFDVVIASNVLHVMMSPERALASIARVMKQEAVLLAPTTYCHGHNLVSSTMSRIMTLRGFKAYHKWSIHSLRVFFENNGYSVVDWRVVRGLIPLVLAVLKKKDEGSVRLPA
jgi:ubiquinone/menaquinone biosynthesis C-methylase UbiE